jgi:hypothetical protein
MRGVIRTPPGLERSSRSRLPNERHCTTGRDNAHRTDISGSFAQLRCRMDMARLVGGYIKLIRQEKGLTQELLADLSGCSQQCIGGLEQGRRNPINCYHLRARDGSRRQLLWCSSTRVGSSELLAGCEPQNRHGAMPLLGLPEPPAGSFRRRAAQPNVPLVVAAAHNAQSCVQYLQATARLVAVLWSVPAGHSRD